MCKSGSCLVCKIVGGIVALVLTLTTIAALIGTYNTHATETGWVFGTVAGSAALVTLIISIFAWHKVVKKLCPCGHHRGGGCGCGGNCGCGSGGVCPGCGKSPCVCK